MYVVKPAIYRWSADPTGGNAKDLRDCVGRGASKCKVVSQHGDTTVMCCSRSGC